jgi:hypothetical protein
MNDTKEATCAERIADQLAGEEQNLKEIYAVLDSTNDGSEIDEAQESLYNYALGMNTIKETTITLSWGGPASYLEILHDGAEITQLTYRFSDWFDTATQKITDEESPLYRYAQEMINIQEGNY